MRRVSRLKSSGWPGRVILWASSSDMILSLNNIHVRFTLVFSWVDGSFFFIAEWYSIACVWEEKQLSIYSSRFLVETFPVKKKASRNRQKAKKNRQTRKNRLPGEKRKFNNMCTLCTKGSYPGKLSHFLKCPKPSP